MVSLLAELLVTLPPETVPLAAARPGESVMAFPVKLKAPAPALKVMPLKSEPAAKSLKGPSRVLPAKKSASFSAGAVSRSQLPPVSQLLSAPPPSHVLLAAEDTL